MANTTLTITNESTISKNQKRTIVKAITLEGKPYMLTVDLRFDDECGNGYNTFTITGAVYRNKSAREPEICGCIHEVIAAHFPELEPLIKWHLCSTDGPMHYIANTVYHAGNLDAWGNLGKTRNLDAARHSAIWPDATHEELTVSPEELTRKLLARLPALLADFRATMEALGFTW